MHSAGSSALHSPRSKTFSASKAANSGAQSQAALRDRADAAPLPVAYFEHFFHDPLRRRRSLPASPSARTGSRPRRGPLRAAPPACGSLPANPPARNPPTTIGTWNSRTSSSYSPIAHHGADVAGRDEALHAIARASSAAARMAGGHQHVRDQHGEIAQSLRAAPATRPWRWRARSSQTQWRRTPLCRSGWARAIFTASIGEYTTRTSPPAAFTRNRSRVRAGHAQHVAVGDQNHLRPARRCAWLCRSFPAASRRPGIRGRARAADLRRNKLIDAIAHQGVRLPAADFHQHPRPAWRGGRFPPPGRGRCVASRYSSRYFMAKTLVQCRPSSWHLPGRRPGLRSGQPFLLE